MSAAPAPAAGASAPRFRLVDDFTAKYIKFQGREPRTLEELAIARAETDHRRRLAEIKVMRAKLALLQEFLPALAERGIKLAQREFLTWDHGKTIIVRSPIFGSDEKLVDALLELGFREVERKELLAGREDRVTLQHGRWLRMAIGVTKPAAPAADTNPPAGA